MTHMFEFLLPRVRRKNQDQQGFIMTPPENGDKICAVYWGTADKIMFITGELFEDLEMV